MRRTPMHDRQPTTTIMVGDALDRLKHIPDASVQCCVTSPPYFGLRDYGEPGQIGLEPTPDEYVTRLVEVFRKVRRVLRDDGTLWLNLGDSYTGSANNGGLKPKDLIGIPWMVAFALRSDGWWLRQDIIWSKPNPMPESVTDRCTKAHEYVFLLTKAARYYYDAEAIKDPYARGYKDGPGFGGLANRTNMKHSVIGNQAGGPQAKVSEDGARNKRSVWRIAAQPYPGSHFAVMPPKLAEPCILAGSAVGDTVLDPFGGAGTTALVANRLGRDAVMIELNPEYAELAKLRIENDAPLLADVRVIEDTDA